MFQYLFHPCRTLNELRIANEAKRKRKQQRDLQTKAACKTSQALARIMLLPVKRMTQIEVETLPGANEPLPDGFLETCPIGTWFMCRQQHELPLVVGQIVIGDDLLCDQWGAGLCLPERGVNRYRLITV